MAATFEPIASTTLGSDVASYTFASIPSTFTDLVIVWHGIQANTVEQSVGLRINSDTGTNYSRTVLYGDGSSAGSVRSSNTTVGSAGTMSGTTANYPSPIILHFMSYANTNVYKTYLTSYASPSAYVGRNVGLWRSTSAITSITLASYFGTSPNLKAGSTLSLYGIKASA